ncbi:MAG: molybdenum cofactor guanylyltransferase [Bacteroidales bacterium]|nr:molybdenum cofactor guanylyltransferase [Bacteroidales bacterium]
MSLKYRNICGVILAGGKATRYKGQDKAFLKINQETFYKKASALLSAIFEDVIVITNKPADFPDDSISKFPDLIKEIGPLGGIHSALTHAPHCEAVFVMAVDMPFISESIIRQICDTYISSQKDIVVPLIKKDIEPLAAVYSKSILIKLTETITQTKKYSIRNFFNLVDTYYCPLDLHPHTVKSFANINSESDYQKHIMNNED